MPRFLIPAGLVLAGVALIAGLVAIAPRAPSSAPVADRQGFGKLPGLSTADAGVSAAERSALAMAPRPAAAGVTGAVTEDAVAPSVGAEPMVARDIAVSGTAVAGSGGGTSGSIGITRPGIPPEEYLAPRIVTTWEGPALPAVPGEMAVFRSRPPGLGGAARSFADAAGLNLPGGSIASFSMRGEDGLTYTYDATSGMLSWYRDRAWATDTGNAEATISDGDAISIANGFLAKLGLDLSSYGGPTVIRNADPCGDGRACIMEGRAADATVTSPPPTSAVAPVKDMMPTIWPGYWPQTVTVRYGAKLDNLPTLDWDGADSGVITVQVSAATRAVENGSATLLRGLERSLYPTQSADAIRAKALLGGINPWGGWGEGVYTPAEEAKRPVVRIVLTEARLGYLQKWSDDGTGPASYFLPVVAFRGTVTDQFGNSYPHAVIVPALDPNAFQSEDPQPVPVPLGKPVPPPEPLPLPAVDAAPARP
ncbi:hypothetical protein EPO33_04625 [Patescibacteria group bacterium]|nr:MAG: hypothetical protein EPO33_04625 [Patescibacteria group bacterium]